MRNYDNLI